MKPCCWLMMVMLLLSSQALPLCLVPKPRLVCAEFFASQAVVEATLLRTRLVHDRDDPEGIIAHIYTLRIEQVFRGKPANTIQVYVANDSGRTTFDWIPRKSYLLFLFRERQREQARSYWFVDGCGNSGPIDKAAVALSQIRAIKNHHDQRGVIHGAVSGETLSTPISELLVVAKGRNGRYTAKTDQNGTFEMRVPAGRYVLIGIEKGFSLEPADISYESSRSIRVEPGGCVQIQLTRTWDAGSSVRQPRP